MIKVNHEPYPYSEGMTVRSLMQAKGFTFPNIVVRINDELVNRSKWDTTPVHDGDDVQMAHIYGGG
jgi:thiamine biosynthesis protein ThiS